MAERFMRLDVSAEARDFEPVTIEPGVPLLDRSNANYRVLRRWLGRMIAEPQWQGETLDLFVCDEEQDRLNQVRCEPATGDDFRRIPDLKRELDELTNRIRTAKPSAKETKILDTVQRHFQKAITASGSSQGSCHFFKYRVAGNWRLVWAWGYQRKDMAPAAPLICTNPNCHHLFVRRSDGNANCPACEKSGLIPPRRSRLLIASVMALLLLLAAGTGFALRQWVWPPAVPPNGGNAPELLVTPADWSGPLGARIEYRVLLRAADGTEQNVTTSACGIAEDPRVLQFDEIGLTAHTLAPGQTPVHFYLNDKITHGTVTVTPPETPQGLTIEPKSVTLGIGSTAQLRVMGQYDGQLPVDLTEAVEWVLTGPQNAFCDAGRLEGIAAGETGVLARYRAKPDDEPVTAEAVITVVQEGYKTLAVDVPSLPLTVGRGVPLTADVATGSGEKRSVAHSSQLSLAVEPPDLAHIEDGFLIATRSGAGELRATFHDVSGETLTAALDIQADDGGETTAVFEVMPKELVLAVGETVQLQVASDATGPVRATSSAADIVQAVSGTRIVGRAVGQAEITLSQGDQQQQVSVEVAPAEIQSIRLEPTRLSVPVDGSNTLRLVGDVGEGREIELATDQLDWEELPNSLFADLDLTTLQVHGRRPTGDSPQNVAAVWGDLRATAQIDVVAAPARIELTPAGPLQLPVGQIQRLRVFATSGDGDRIEIAPDQLQWKIDPAEVDGLQLDRTSSVVHAAEAGAGPIGVRAVYQGNQSNRVELRAVNVPLALQLQSDRTLVLVGDSGQVNATPAGGTELDTTLDGVQFRSTDPAVLAVDQRTGAYRALAAGTASVTAVHPRAEKPAECRIQVVAADQAKLVLRPSNIKLPPGGRQPLELVLAADDQEEVLSWHGTEPSVDLDIARPDAVRWDAPQLLGLSPSEPFEVIASYRGNTARATVEVLPDEKPTAIRVVPASATLAPGQSISPRVEQQLPASGEGWVELEPLQIAWNVPPTVHWTPPSGNLRPQLSPGDASPGTVQIDAEYEGLKAELKIDVTDQPPPTSGPLLLVREPAGQQVPAGTRQRYSILVGEGGQAVPASGVRWMDDFENDYVRWDAPVLYAKLPGHTQPLHAIVDDQRVDFAVQTSGQTPLVQASGSQDGGLQPSVLRLKVGETKWIGRDVTLNWDGEDQSERLQLVSMAPGIVRCNGDNRSVEGIAPGRAELAVAAGTQRFLLPVLVEAWDGDGSVVIERTDGAVAVGESRDLRVLLVTDDGGRVDRTGSALLDTDQPDVLAVRGTRVTGVSAGSCNVRARLPGIESPGTATLTVTEEAFTELRVTPSTMQLDVGDVETFQVIGVGPGGQHVLSEHPDLTLQAVGETPEAIQLLGASRLRGACPGEVALQVSWRDLSAPPVPVRVVAEPVSQLVIEPATTTVAVGDLARFAVFARRGDQQRVLAGNSGAVLHVADPAIAEARSGLTAEGVSPGTTEVAVQLGSHRAMAKLVVVPATVRRPPLPWQHLRFVPDALELQLGVPTAGVHLARVNANGRQEDVEHRAEIAIADSEIVEVAWTAAGPVFRGKREGYTTAIGTWGKLTTPRPLQIRVRDSSRPGASGCHPRAQLEVSPDPLHLVVGQSDTFRSVRVIPGSGAPSFAVDYRLQTHHPSIVSVDKDQQLRGLAPGLARVTVTPIDSLGPYADLSTNVTVQVEAVSSGSVPAGVDASNQPRLVLRGPSRTTVGARTEYRVELIDHSTRRDITNDGAVLVLNRDQAEQVELLSGCSLLAREPGMVYVRARARDMISNSLPLRIDPRAVGYDRLEFDIDRRPFAVGESRSYRIWGHPIGGGPRQDLTGLVNADKSAGEPVRVAFGVLAPSEDAEIVSHAAPVLQAEAPGRFRIAAAYGSLRSDLIELSIVADDCVALRAIPSSVTIRVGERTPPLWCVARFGQSQTSRRVSAVWTSENEAVAAPIPDVPNRFVGQAVGITRATASFGDCTTSVSVTVTDDVFRDVIVQKTPERLPGGRFAVIIEILASGQQASSLQYRVSPTGAPEQGQWKTATTNADGSRSLLTGPSLREGPADTVYHLVIEARDADQRIVARYPLEFELEKGDYIRQR